MSKTQKIILLLALFLLVTTGGVLSSQTGKDAISDLFAGPVRTYTYEIVNQWPHDTSSFTEGLIYKNDTLYESAGRNGASSLRIVDLTTGKIESKVDLSSEYFAEGIALLNEKIFQLTWQNHMGFIYDAQSLKLLGDFNYQGEGWGLTDDGHSLIMSNGTNSIIFLDPKTFEVLKTINVYDNDQPLMQLNELEYVHGRIYANIWHSDKIVQIDPKSGKIRGWIDLTRLFPADQRSDREAVLNGIAYDQANDRLFVTGKLWPWIYEIKLKAVN